MLTDADFPTTEWVFAKYCGVMVLYQKSGVESVTQEGAAIWAAITNIENASETTMTTPTPLLTSSGSCPWPFPWPVHPPACPGNGSVA